MILVSCNLPFDATAYVLKTISSDLWRSTIPELPYVLTMEKAPDIFVPFDQDIRCRGVDFEICFHGINQNREAALITADTTAFDDIQADFDADWNVFYNSSQCTFIPL